MKFARITALTMIFISLCTFTVKADELSDALDQKQYYDNQLDEIINQKDQQQGIYNSASNEKKQYQTQEEQVKQEIDQTQGTIQQIEQELSGLNNVIKQSEDNYSNKLKQLQTRLNSIYQQSNGSYLNVLIESKSITDFFQRIQYLMQISKHDKKIMQELNETKLDLQNKRKLVEETKAQNEKIMEEKQRDIEYLSASRARVEETAREAQLNLSSLNQQEDGILEMSRALTDFIVSNGGGAQYAGGDMMWPSPTSNGISSYFGYRLHPILGTYKMHTGIDINVAWGEPTLAANSGVVIFAGYQSGYGYTIIIDHGGGKSTLYAHSSELLVHTGMLVEKGMTIARVGSTGLSTGPHLHFEVRINGEVQDPLAFVSP